MLKIMCKSSRVLFYVLGNRHVPGTGVTRYMHSASLLLQSSTLLRLADREDHLYLLNQILRCPAGIAKWAACHVQMIDVPRPLLQLPSSDQSALSSPLLDHYLAVLDMTLNPIRCVTCTS